MFVDLLWAHEGSESMAKSDLSGERRNAVCCEGLGPRWIVDGARVERNLEAVGGSDSGDGFLVQSWTWVLKAELYLAVVCWWEVGCRRFRERASESEVTSIWRPVRDNRSSVKFRS
jgi:hypothetical protein